MKYLLALSLTIILCGCGSEHKTPSVDQIQLGWTEQQIKDFCLGYKKVKPVIVNHEFVEDTEVKVLRYWFDKTPYLFTLVKPNYSDEKIESIIVNENVSDPNNIAFVTSLYQSEVFWLLKTEVDRQEILRKQELLKAYFSGRSNRSYHYTPPADQSHTQLQMHQLPRHMTPNGDGSFTLH